MAAALGRPLMPWQQMVADIAGELDPDTWLPAYREVVFSLMRQQGKTILILGIEVDRCLMWETPQTVVYTAQTGADAREKLMEDHVPIMEASIPRRIRRIYKSRGEESVQFRNGSRIGLNASSKKSGHGATVDLAILDEIWADEDERREQTLVPMMLTRPAAQMLVCSTMGEESSVLLNRKVKLGRQAATEDPGSGIAYFEWSVPEDADIENPEVWWRHMPALGHTITQAAVEHAFRTMEEAEFRRAFMNQQVALKVERDLPAAFWEAIQYPDAEVPMAGARIGVDILPDRSAAAVVASDGNTVELIRHGAGTNWLVDEVARIAQDHRATVVLDGGGPAGSLATELEDAGVKVETLTNALFMAACAKFYDAVIDKTLAVRPAPSFDAAADGIVRRPVGDRFVWSRTHSRTDATPLVAAVLAFAAEAKPKAKAPKLFVAGGKRGGNQDKAKDQT